MSTYDIPGYAFEQFRKAGFILVLLCAAILKADDPVRIDLYDSQDNHLLYTLIEKSATGMRREVYAPDGYFLREVVSSSSESGDISNVFFNYDERQMGSSILQTEGSSNRYVLEDDSRPVLSASWAQLDEKTTAVSINGEDDLNVTSMEYKRDAEGRVEKIEVYGKDHVLLSYGVVAYPNTAMKHVQKVAERFTCILRRSARRYLLHAVIPQACILHVAAYNCAGKKLAVFHDAVVQKGLLTVDLEGQNVVSKFNGLVLLRITAGSNEKVYSIVSGIAP